MTLPVKPAVPRGRYLAYMSVAALACLQWCALRAMGIHPPQPWAVVLPGLAVLGAAFLLSWTAEAAELDMPQGLSVALLALIAVLPEYAVDMYFAWQAGKDVTYAAYAAANMTGSNRLLIGLGWAAVLAAYWAKHRKKEIQLDSSIAPEMVALGIATVYAFLIPLKATLSWVDSVFLIGLFAVYAWRTAQAEHQEPELTGPAALIGMLSTPRRRLMLTVLFLFSAVSIFASAEPFAEGLLDAGRHWGVDEFILVQWLAPLASEAPEFIVAVLFALKGNGSVGLRILIASKVNQWTLLVGMLPAVFNLSAGSLAPMPLDVRQVEEVLLTAAQSFFALATLVNLRFSAKEAFALALLFFTQMPLTSPAARHTYSLVYIFGGIFLLVFRRSGPRIMDLVRNAVRF